MLDDFIEQYFNQAITHKTNISTGLLSAYKIILANNQTIFVKHQTQTNDNFITEAKELEVLNKFISTPKVLFANAHFLILQWIESVYNPHAQDQLGKDLAYLHQQKSDYFGFDFDNKIGTTSQNNAVDKHITHWDEFYWNYRLLPQINLAKNNNFLDNSEYKLLLNIEKILHNILPNSITPSLLHGDLWSGNYLSGKTQIYFIDSACYYGHNEVDFALTFMFGGFDDDFYKSYQEVISFADGFELRKPLYMLYHYLNHLNIFGSSYKSPTLSCCKRLLQN